jgi:putative effector of murein hydrolase
MNFFKFFRVCARLRCYMMMMTAVRSFQLRVIDPLLRVVVQCVCVCMCLCGVHIKYTVYYITFHCLDSRFLLFQKK